MAVITLPVVTNPQGAHLQDVNGNPISSADKGFPTTDRLRSLIMNGQGFTATSGVLATATNANVYIAMGLLWSSQVFNCWISRINAELEQAVTGAVRVTQATTLDANLTAAVTPLNNNLGSAVTSLATVKTTANANTAPTATSGTLRQVNGSIANPNANIEVLQQGSGIFIPAGTTYGITVWVLAPTAGNAGQINFEYVEF